MTLYQHMWEKRTKRMQCVNSSLCQAVSQLQTFIQSLQLRKFCEANYRTLKKRLYVFDNESCFQNIQKCIYILKKLKNESKANYVQRIKAGNIDDGR